MTQPTITEPTTTQPTIERIELRVLDPGKGVRWTTRAGACVLSTTVITVTDSEGAVGVAGVDAFTYGAGDRTTLESVRSMWPRLHGAPIDSGEDLVRDLRVGVIFPLVLNGLSLVDMALWDLRAKHAGQPLWSHLGGTRDRILAYASTESMPTIEDYVEVAHRAVASGYTALKVHAFGDPDQDIAVHTRLRETHPDLVIMHDAEGVYSREEALRVGQALAELDCTWFEAPLPELDFEGYRELRSRIPVPVLASGYALGDADLVAGALADSPWTACRSEIASTQGITGLRTLMGIAERHGRRLEPVTYGSAMYALAGLQVILSSDSATYMELAYPEGDWEYGIRNPLRPDADGFVHAPAGDGLGFDLDEDAIERLTVHRSELAGRA